MSLIPSLGLIWFCLHTSPQLNLIYNLPEKETVCVALSVEFIQAALFPSALRVKRGMASMVNPTIQQSILDVNVLFEIMLSGLQFGDERGPFSVLDAELASLRQTRKLEVVCEDVLPRKLTDVRRLTSDLSNHHGHLRLNDFERTVLTMVYTAQRLPNTTSGHQRELWAESFVNLYQAIKQDLIGQ